MNKQFWNLVRRDFESKIGLNSETVKMNRTTLKKLVKEEYNKILEDCQKAAPKIEKKLEECRKSMMEELLSPRVAIGTSFAPPLEKRIQINTVAEMIDVPVNELTLYFLNHVKTKNERSLVEYHLGHVYFYAI